MTTKIRVAVLFGGRSSEHSVSCVTARGVLSAIDAQRYEVIPVGITRHGAFVLAGDEVRNYHFDSGNMPEVVDNGTRVIWPDSVDDHELRVTEGGATRSLGTVDIVFPILHGPFGEDGTIQGMLELYSLPYVGSGVLASSLGMDKHFAKTVIAQAGIAVAPWRTVTDLDWANRPDTVRAVVTQLGLPVFVKPARAGSSVGVTKVKTAADLDAAMTAALAEDTRVLIEATIIGREIECAVLQDRPGKPTRASVAGEIVVRGREFYDFDAKYLDAPGIDLVCPADLTADELAELQRLSVRAFEAIGGAGLARVDFFLMDAPAAGSDASAPSRFVLNEINTMPGFTPISMFPRCWQETGLAYPDLIDELIQVARAHRGR
ncbi:MAG: D-alanine--D-alanine ligase [Microbacteriaceae bacterium]|nr:D-alanine--D-alanine ligase [Microbacteriaceae bacterium]